MAHSHQTYADFFKDSQREHQIAEVERQLNGYTRKRERQLEEEARSAATIANHFPRVIPDTPLIEMHPGYYIHRNEWEAHRDGLSVVTVTDERTTSDPELISYQWNHFVVAHRSPWALEDYRIKYYPFSRPEHVAK
ncbi:hypothetical protein ACXYLT_003079 [Klebsiella aerogenes]